MVTLKMVSSTKQFTCPSCHHARGVAWCSCCDNEIAENERLSRRLEWHEAMAGEVKRLSVENERLRAALKQIRWLAELLLASATGPSVATAESLIATIDNA